MGGGGESLVRGVILETGERELSWGTVRMKIGED